MGMAHFWKITACLSIAALLCFGTLGGTTRRRLAFQWNERIKVTGITNRKKIDFNHDNGKHGDCEACSGTGHCVAKPCKGTECTMCDPGKRGECRSCNGRG